MLKNRIVLILAFINIISNGSMRGALILFIFLILFYLIYRKKSRILLISTMLISIIFVFSITVFSVAYLGDNSGNYFRVIAWISDLEQLYNNPLFGGGPFLYSNYPGNSIQAIQEFGIAESLLLDIGIRYGIFPMFIYLYVIYKIFNKFYFMNKVQHSLENTVFTTIASVVLVDIFYGTFLGSTFTTAIFGLMAFSYQNKRFFVNNYRRTKIEK